MNHWKFFKTPEFLRDLIFGVEDGLVSTVGLLAGVAVSDVPKSTLFLTGMILIVVEAFSMGVGSIIADNSVATYTQHKEVEAKNSYAGGAVMFFSYALAGLIPLLPYVLFDNTKVTALWVSVGLTLLALFVMGLGAAKVSRVPLLKHAGKMLLLGGFAVVVGVVVGKFVTGL